MPKSKDTKKNINKRKESSEDKNPKSDKKKQNNDLFTNVYKLVDADDKLNKSHNLVDCKNTKNSLNNSKMSTNHCSVDKHEHTKSQTAKQKNVNLNISYNDNNTSKNNFGDFEEMIIDSKNWSKNKSGDNFKSAFKLVYDIIYKLNSKVLNLSSDKDKLTRTEMFESLATKCDSKQLNAFVEQLKTFIENRPT